MKPDGNMGFIRPVKRGKELPPGHLNSVIANIYPQY